MLTYGSKVTIFDTLLAGEVLGKSKEYQEQMSTVVKQLPR